MRWVQVIMHEWYVVNCEGKIDVCKILDEELLLEIQRKIHQMRNLDFDLELNRHMPTDPIENSKKNANS